MGTIELEASLAPALAFLRDLGRAFATRLRATPDVLAISGAARG